MYRIIYKTIKSIKDIFIFPVIYIILCIYRHWLIWILQLMKSKSVVQRILHMHYSKITYVW